MIFCTKNVLVLVEKILRRHLTAYAAKEYFYEMLILLILLRKINKISIS